MRHLSVSKLNYDAMRGAGIAGVLAPTTGRPSVVQCGLATAKGYDLRRRDDADRHLDAEPGWLRTVQLQVERDAMKVSP